MTTNKTLWVSAGIVLAAMFAVWLGLSWFEADKEIRVLCSMFHPGQSMDAVVETLDTGEYLRYRSRGSASEQYMYVDSVYNLGTSNCTIGMSGDTVTSSIYNE